MQILAQSVTSTVRGLPGHSEHRNPMSREVELFSVGWLLLDTKKGSPRKKIHLKIIHFYIVKVSFIEISATFIGYNCLKLHMLLQKNADNVFEISKKHYIKFTAFCLWDKYFNKFCWPVKRCCYKPLGWLQTYCSCELSIMVLWKKKKIHMRPG